MSISINKINNCDNLTRDKIHELAKKLNIDYEDIIDSTYDPDDADKKICTLVKKQFKNIKCQLLIIW